jgi:hypothetical protein
MYGVEERISVFGLNFVIYRFLFGGLHYNSVFITLEELHLVGNSDVIVGKTAQLIYLI